MNTKTAKLLQRYATKTGQDYRAVKREWSALNSVQRSRKRAEIAQELGAS